MRSSSKTWKHRSLCRCSTTRKVSITSINTSLCCCVLNIKKKHADFFFFFNWMYLSILPAGGLWHTSLIDKNLVDFFVPFLPLEYRHVVQCVMSGMADRGHQPDQDVADQVARDLVYFPKSERVFAVKGCKTIESKLDYYI